jgi:hypothetical protein
MRPSVASAYQRRNMEATSMTKPRLIKILVCIEIVLVLLLIGVAFL